MSSTVGLIIKLFSTLSAGKTTSTFQNQTAETLFCKLLSFSFLIPLAIISAIVIIPFLLIAGNLHVSIVGIGTLLIIPHRSNCLITVVLDCLRFNFDSC